MPTKSPLMVATVTAALILSFSVVLGGLRWAGSAAEWKQCGATQDQALFLPFLHGSPDLLECLSIASHHR